MDKMLSLERSSNELLEKQLFDQKLIIDQQKNCPSGKNIVNEFDVLKKANFGVIKAIEDVQKEVMKTGIINTDQQKLDYFKLEFQKIQSQNDTLHDMILSLSGL